MDLGVKSPDSLNVPIKIGNHPNQLNFDLSNIIQPRSTKNSTNKIYNKRMYSDNFEKRKKSENITSQNKKYFEKNLLIDDT